MPPWIRGEPASSRHGHRRYLRHASGWRYEDHEQPLLIELLPPARSISPPTRVQTCERYLAPLALVEHVLMDIVLVLQVGVGEEIAYNANVCVS